MIYNVTDQAQKAEGKINLSWDLQKIEGDLKLSTKKHLTNINNYVIRN